MRYISLAILFFALSCSSSEPTSSSAGGTGGAAGGGGCGDDCGTASSASGSGGGGGAGGAAGGAGAGGAGGAAGGGGQGGGGCELACEPMPLGTFIKIDVYEWKGETVYLTLGDCCDQFDEVFTEACARICAPSGGKTGTGDGKCPTFYDEAVFVCTAWAKNP